MKKAILCGLIFFISISLYSVDFKWAHNYQENSSMELVSLVNRLCEGTPVKCVQTEGFFIERPAFSIKCGHGNIFYEIDKRGILRGFYYEGNALVSFSTDDKNEAERLEKCLQKRKLAEEPIKSFYVLPLGVCSDLPKCVEESVATTKSQNMCSLKSGFRRDAIKTLNYLLNSENQGNNDLIVLFELKNEIWGYQLNSTLENEVQLLRLSHPPYNDYEMWDPVVSLHITSDGRLTPYITDYEYKSKIAVDVKKYDINFYLNRNGVLNNGVVKAFVSLSKPQTSLLFDFFPGFKINKVVFKDKECDFIKEDFSKTYSYYDTSLLVRLPEKTKGEFELTFDISGNLFDKAEGYIYPIEEDLWFPFIKDYDGFIFSFSATVPKGLEVISVGELISRKSADKTENFLWYSSIPIKNATFTMGSFIHKKIDIEEGLSLDVALPKDLRTNILTQAQGYTLNELKNVVLFYEKVFGKTPYKNLKVVITPYSYGRAFKWRGFSIEKIRKSKTNVSGIKDLPVAGSRHLTMLERKIPASLQLSNYGRGFPTLIMLTESAFYRSGDSQPEKLLAHQVALNWWDSLVSPLSERDVWLSVGMAEFSSLLYIEGRFGARTGRIFRENMLTGGSLAKRVNLSSTIDIDEYPSNTFFSKVDIFSSTGENAIPFDDGPICFGTRIFSTSASEPVKSYESIIYTKSAFVFGMLYNLSRFTNEKEEGFFRGLRNICSKYGGQRISTSAFFKELENSMKIPLSAFLKGWYESNGIPKVEVKTSTLQKDGTYFVTAEGKCDSDLFIGVPITVTLQNKKKVDYLLLFQNKSAIGQWKIGEKPKKIEVDPAKVIFCSYGKVK